MSTMTDELKDTMICRFGRRHKSTKVVSFENGECISYCIHCYRKIVRDGLGNWHLKKGKENE